MEMPESGFSQDDVKRVEAECDELCGGPRSAAEISAMNFLARELAPVMANTIQLAAMCLGVDHRRLARLFVFRQHRIIETIEGNRAAKVTS